MFILARLVEQVWDNIRESGSEADWTSPDEIENGLGLFSQEHLKYVVARGLEKRNADLSPQNRPIAWWTLRSRHNEAGHLRAFKFRLRPNHIPPVAAGQGESSNLGEMLEQISPHVITVGDDFWNAMKMVGNDDVRFDYLMLFRLLYHHISETCRDHSVNISQNQLKNAMVEFKICGTDLTSFWDDKEKCQTHIKNHLCKANGYTISGMKYFKQKYAGERLCDRKSSARKAMIGVSLPQILEMFDSSPDVVSPIEVPFLTDASVHSHLRQEHFQKLNQDGNGFSNLAETMKHSCKHGIISRSLLQKLLEFRLKWNQNRQQYANERNNGIPDEECTNANVRLLKSAGFKGNEAAGFSLKPSGRRH